MTNSDLPDELEAGARRGIRAQATVNRIIDASERATKIAIAFAKMDDIPELSTAIFYAQTLAMRDNDEQAASLAAILAKRMA